MAFRPSRAGTSLRVVGVALSLSQPGPSNQTQTQQLTDSYCAIGGSFRDSRFPTGWLASCAWMFWACESGLIVLSVGLEMSRFRFGFGLVFGVVHDDVVVPPPTFTLSDKATWDKSSS